MFGFPLEQVLALLFMFFVILLGVWASRRSSRKLGLIRTASSDDDKLEVEPHERFVRAIASAFALDESSTEGLVLQLTDLRIFQTIWQRLVIHCRVEEEHCPNTARVLLDQVLREIATFTDSDGFRAAVESREGDIRRAFERSLKSADVVVPDCLRDGFLRKENAFGEIAGQIERDLSSERDLLQ